MSKCECVVFKSTAGALHNANTQFINTLKDDPYICIALSAIRTAIGIAHSHIIIHIRTHMNIANICENQHLTYAAYDLRNVGIRVAETIPRIQCKSKAGDVLIFFV